MVPKEKYVAPTIYAYHDYRSFLKDWLNHLKIQKKVTALSISKRTGLSAGFIPRVIANQKHLSAQALQKIIPELRLNKKEAAYLELLHELAVSTSPQTRISILERLQNFPEYQELNPREIELFRYMTRWHYVAIKEMAELPDFKDEVEWIQSRLAFKVNARDITEALEFLFENKFLEKQANGKVRTVDRDIKKCATPVFAITLKDFHRQIFQLAQESMETIPRDERYIYGYSFSVEDFAEVKKTLEETVAKLKEIHKRTKNNGSVYHVEFAAFPFSKKS